MVGDQKPNDALHCPTRSGFSRMHSPTDENHWFVEQLPGGLQVLFRPDHPVVVVRDVLVVTGLSIPRGNGDHVDEVEVGGVAEDFLPEVEVAGGLEVADHVQVSLVGVGQGEGEVDDWGFED